MGENPTNALYRKITKPGNIFDYKKTIKTQKQQNEHMLLKIMPTLIM